MPPRFHQTDPSPRTDTKPPLRVTFRDINQDLLNAATLRLKSNSSTGSVGALQLEPSQLSDDDSDESDDDESDAHDSDVDASSSRASRPRLKTLVPRSDMNLASLHLLDILSDTSRIAGEVNSDDADDEDDDDGSGEDQENWEW